MRYTLYWGDDNVRLGWFLKQNGKQEWVHGPSICVSSGGGPVAALQRVALQRTPLHPSEVNVIIPNHSDINGVPCNACSQALQEYKAKFQT